MQLTTVKQRIVTKLPANPLMVLKQNSGRPLNVAAYCRVSTDSEDQINSYNAQRNYYREKIMSNPKWRFVDIYADEGITGTLAKKRDDFLRMISDCEKGKIDLILTKSVSRYARNVVDSLSYLRKLKALGIGIFFEEQNINSLTEESETYIGIYSILAQSESENISGNVKWGINKRMQNGTYACRFNLLGYRRDKETNEPYIVPEEAVIVRKIFNMFLDGLTTVQIKEYLEKNGILTNSGKSKWSRDVIHSMLQNEKYVGDVIYQKTFRTDPISKHVVINRGQRDKYLVSNNHPAIIDRETFMRTQSEIARRNNKRKTSDLAKTELGKYSGKFALSELLFCSECGSHYKRKTWSQKGFDKKIYWRCQSKIEHGKEFCKKSKGIEESVLHKTICKALQKLECSSYDAYMLIKANLKYAVTGSESCFDVFAIEECIMQKEKQASDLFKLSIKTGGDTEKYETEIVKIYSEIKTLREQVKQAQLTIQENEIKNEEISNAAKWVEENETIFEDYDESIIRRLVDTINVNSDNSITVFIKGGLEIKQVIGE